MHTTTKTAKKIRYCPYTPQLFLTTVATILSPILYMGNNFYNVIFKKIVWEIVLVWEGLQVFKSTGIFDNIELQPLFQQEFARFP